MEITAATGNRREVPLFNCVGLSDDDRNSIIGPQKLGFKFDAFDSRSFSGESWPTHPFHDTHDFFNLGFNVPELIFQIRKPIIKDNRSPLEK